MDIINPEQAIDQINETLINPSYPYLIGTTPAVYYTLDGYRVECDSATMPQLSVKQSAGMFGSKSSILFTVTQAKASTAALDNDNLELWLTPDMIREFMWGTPYAAPMTLSFDANASVAGNYSVAAINGIDTVYCVGIYTIATGGTAVQRCSMTFPAMTTGDFSNGVKLLFDLGTGTTYTASTLNVWTSGAAWKASGSVSLTRQSVGSWLQLGRIQADAGNSALPFRFIPMENQLQTAQRFLYKTFPQGTAVNNSVRGGVAAGLAGSFKLIAPASSPGAGLMFDTRYPVEMSLNPVLYSFSPGLPSDNHWYRANGNLQSSVPGYWVGSQNGVGIQNPASTDPNGSCYFLHLVASAQWGGNGYISTFAP